MPWYSENQFGNDRSASSFSHKMSYKFQISSNIFKRILNLSSFFIIFDYVLFTTRTIVSKQLTYSWIWFHQSINEKKKYTRHRLTFYAIGGWIYYVDTFTMGEQIMWIAASNMLKRVVLCCRILRSLWYCNFLMKNKGE